MVILPILPMAIRNQHLIISRFTKQSNNNTTDMQSSFSSSSSPPSAAAAGHRGATNRNTNGGPPPGYIPGLGRGAVGFTTRGDAVGGSGVAAVVGDGTKSRSAEARLVKQQQRDLENTAAAAAVDQFKDPEDEEADEIWEYVDKRMKGKRKRTRNDSTNDGDDDRDSDDRNGDDRVQQIGVQFRELKEQLAQVTEDQWAAIPDVGDHSLKYKQKRRQQDTITPLSDTLLEQRHQRNTANTATTNVMDGTATTNMSGLSAARGTVLGMSLDKQASSASSGFQTTTSVDATGYLTSLQTTTAATSSTAADIHDITKARLLLQSVRDTNPQHGPGWIAAARVEEAAGNVLQARKILQQACSTCPHSVDVWLEAARLHPVDVAKSILATAVRKVPQHSNNTADVVPLYLKAAALETTVRGQQAVYQTALEAHPTSVTLWKAAVALQPTARDARVLLRVAVEKVPHAVDLWLALARLESYANAQVVLNKARQAVPTDRSIWIAAAQLEEGQLSQTGGEQTSSTDKTTTTTIDKIIQRAVTSLLHKNNNEVVVSRQQWLQDATAAERAGAPLTCAAIVRHTSILHGIDPEDQVRTWSEDAKSLVQQGSIVTARAVLTEALQIVSHRKLWMQAVELERSNGTPESLDAILERACTALPHTQVFWLLRAQHKWLNDHDVAGAREVLTQALMAAAPESDTTDVWLAAAKLEWENGFGERARVVLQRARERAPSARVFIKSVVLEREHGQYAAALELIEKGIALYPEAAKLYMMGGQICFHQKSVGSHHDVRNLDRARSFYQRGIEKCPTNHTLWTLASRLEEDSAKDSAAGFTKARSVLELGRRKNPKCPELWLEATRLERRSGNDLLAETLMAKALQECPSAGILWAESIATAPRVQQKSKATDSIQRCPEDPHVIAAVASFFAAERKHDKARKWFDRAVILNPDLGDSWARYYAFEQQRAAAGENKNGDGEDRLVVLRQRCEQAAPKHGEIWASVMKQDVAAASHDNSNNDRVRRKRSIAQGLEEAARIIQANKRSNR